MICPKHFCELTPMIYTSFCNECEKEKDIEDARAIWDSIPTPDHKINLSAPSKNISIKNIPVVPCAKKYTYEAGLISNAWPCNLKPSDFPPTFSGLRAAKRIYAYDMVITTTLPGTPRGGHQIALFHEYDWHPGYVSLIDIEFNAVFFTLSKYPANCYFHITNCKIV